MMMIFADRKDSLRKEYQIRAVAIDKLLNNIHPELKIPMPALGETYCMIRGKCKEREKEVFDEMSRLFDKGIVSTAYIGDAESTFYLAKTFSEEVRDDRDYISPMDALILATAVADEKCQVFYTTDSRLMTNSALAEKIHEWREEHNYPQLKIKEAIDLIKSGS